MRRSRILGSVLAALLLASLIPAPSVYAQATGSAPRPAGGLFGPRASTGDERDRLNLNGTITEGLDTELPPELGSQLPRGALNSGGWSTIMTGSADYLRKTNRLQLVANGKSTFRYFERLNRFDAISHTAALGANVRLPAMTSLQIDQRAAYSPSFLFQLFPSNVPPSLGQPIEPAPDHRIVQSDSYIYQTEANLGRRLTSRTQASIGAAYDRTNFYGLLAEQTRRPKLDSFRGRANVGHNVTRNVGLSAGYEYRTGDFGFGVTHQHGISLGAEYERALSRSRRALFSGYISPSTLEVPQSSVNPSAGRLFRLQGGISVDYPFRYGWTASASLRRGIDYLALLAEPVLSDAGRVSVSGLITRRLDVAGTIGFAQSASAINQLTQLDSRTASVRARVGLTQHVALFTEYVYFSYDLTGNDRLSGDLPSVLDQHGLRFGVTLWTTPF